MKSSVLGVALAVSILINVALLGRRAPEPAAPPPTAAKPAAAPAADVAAELERERALNRELRESVRRLEEEKAVLAQAATAPGASAAAVAAKPSLREKLRRIKKVVKAAEEGGQPDQEAMLEMSGEIMEIFRLGLTRGKDPQTYADFIQACAEIGLEDEAPLTPDQALRMSEILKEMAGELGRISAGSGVERLIREL